MMHCLRRKIRRRSVNSFVQPAFASSCTACDQLIGPVPILIIAGGFGFDSEESDVEPGVPASSGRPGKGQARGRPQPAQRAGGKRKGKNGPPKGLRGGFGPPGGSRTRGGNPKRGGGGGGGGKAPPFNIPGMPGGTIPKDIDLKLLAQVMESQGDEDFARMSDKVSGAWSR